MAEFGSSPCLLDEIARNPEMAARAEASIPNLEDRPAGEQRYPGDLAKIGGIIHVWLGSWVTLGDAGKLVFCIQDAPVINIPIEWTEL